MSKPLTARVVYDSERLTHVAVFGDGAKPATVRTSAASGPVWCCLTCHTTECQHVEAGRAEYERYETSRKAQAEEDV